MSTRSFDPVVRLAHAVGDFSHPSYAEERHRDVGNETSASGLQRTSRLGVTPTSGNPALRWRLLPYLALFAGVARSGAGESSSSFAQGMLVGAVVGSLLAVVAVWRAARA